METPPDNRPPLGKAFLLTFLGPLFCIAIAAALPAVTHRLDEGVALWFLTLPVMVICSIICGAIIGCRSGAGIGFLSFLGIIIFYAGVALAGCAAVAPKI